MRVLQLFIVSLILLFVASSRALMGWYLIFDSSLITTAIENNQKFNENFSSESFWNDSSMLPPIHMDLYFFNWTNPEDFNKQGKKPNLVEVGPYSFLFAIKNENIKFHSKNGTVSYFQKYSWFFDEDRSTGTLQDKITQLDAVAVSAIHRARYLHYELQNLFYTVGSESNFSIIKTVDELLFSGYRDKLMELEELVGIEKWLSSDRFGWFYKRNGSFNFNGNFNMGTGTENINNLGILKTWNYKTSTKYFRKPCNQTEESAGNLWPPNQTENDIKLFIPDLCRPLIYEFNREIKYMGIEGNQYTLGEETLGKIKEIRHQNDQTKYFKKKNLTEKDDDHHIINSCYCNGDCYPSGLINITACRNGSPVFVSLPHFYKADPILNNQVVGMSPNEKDHSFYIILEPMTEIPLELAVRLQINMLLPLSQNVSSFRDVPQIYFPIFWYSIKVQTSKKIISHINSLLLTPHLYKTAGLLLITFSAIVAVSNIGYVIYYFAKRIKRDLEAKVSTPHLDIPMVLLDNPTF